MEKKKIREIYLKKRLVLSEEEAKLLSNKLVSSFFSFFNLSAIKSVHLFLPIQHKAEINTWLIVHELWRNFPHIDVVVPKIGADKNEMYSFLLSPETPVIENAWGIPEPDAAASSFDDLNLDMVLLPLLAFDENGNRVGYGKGFYDRFLLHCRKDVVKCGMSFFEAGEVIEDAGVHDVALDYCITPEKIYAFNLYSRNS